MEVEERKPHALRLSIAISVWPLQGHLKARKGKKSFLAFPDTH